MLFGDQLTEATSYYAPPTPTAEENMRRPVGDRRAVTTATQFAALLAASQEDVDHDVDVTGELGETMTATGQANAAVVYDADCRNGNALNYNLHN